ncbi:hypothetical protein RND71_030034 [Anisodus tanguticus]|uniref:Uncharacterized protein n=1 Tax=Anisodus tanguticus TaxID=243964 RepID=A0AAE1RGN8_9SOLA|nr:hypothetical protein RND71_030034 [Anisodus tanguticus]
MHATKDRVESDTSTVYSISLYESTMTTRNEPWFGELKLADHGKFRRMGFQFLLPVLPLGMNEVEYPIFSDRA